MSAPVVLVLGSGPNIGANVAKAFAAKGYRVALASRKANEKDNTKGQINISSDLSDPSSVADVFSKVKSQLAPPSVVVYNGKKMQSLSNESTLTSPPLQPQQ